MKDEKTIHKVKCSQCGKSKFVNPQALTKRITKYGSIEEIEKKWICRDCLKLNKDDSTKEEVAEEKTPEEVAETTVDEAAGSENIIRDN